MKNLDPVPKPPHDLLVGKVRDGDHWGFEKILEQLCYMSLVIFVISLPISYSGQAIGLTLGLITWLVSVVYRKKFRDIITSKIGIFIVIFILVMIIRTIISHIDINSLDGLRKILGCIVFFFIVSCGIKTEQQLRKIISILVIATTTAAIYGILQYFTGLNLTGLEKVKAFDRVQGTLCANSLGGIFGMILPVSFSLGLFYKKKFYWVCFSIITICLALTFTRGAWLGSIIAISFIILIHNKKLLLPLVIILLIVFFLWPQGHMRIVNTFKKDSELTRRNMWQIAFKMAKEKFFLGYGLQSFSEVFDASTLSTEKGHSHCHNIYLGLAAETGILGLLSFILLAVYSLILNLKLVIKLQYNWMKFLLLGIAGSIIDFLIHGFVDYTLYGETGYLFGFFLGLIAFEDVSQCHCERLPPTFSVKKMDT